MTIPNYINEIIADMRRIKPGWYAVDDRGKVSSGPYFTCEECLRTDGRLRAARPEEQSGPPSKG